MKKLLSIMLVLTMALTLLAGCGGSGSSSTLAASSGSTAGSSSAPAEQTLKVAAIETAYGSDMWKEVCAAFEAANPGVTVELTTDKKLEDVIGPSMKAGDYPDVIHLATGREAALTETFIKDNGILDITDVLDMTVPGEDVKVKDKIAGGFTDSSLTNPYGDGKTYLAPMFYSPCGLFYNAGLLEEKGWEVPATWDEMWELGDKAKAEGISLFTYPTTGYFDAFFYALMYTAGGPEFFDKATRYEEGIWDTEEAKTCFDIVAKLAEYTEPTTPANANDDNFTKNQQLVLDNKAIFMPNGTWIVGEMAEAPRADGFKWGFTALPAVKEGGDRTATPGLSRPGSRRQPSIRTLPSSSSPTCTATKPRPSLPRRAPSSPSWAWRKRWRATTRCSIPFMTTARRPRWAALPPLRPSRASIPAASGSTPSTAL